MEAGLLETSQAFNSLRSWVREGFSENRRGLSGCPYWSGLAYLLAYKRALISWKLPCRDTDNRFCGAFSLEGFRADREIFEL